MFNVFSPELHSTQNSKFLNTPLPPPSDDVTFRKTAHCGGGEIWRGNPSPLPVDGTYVKNRKKYVESMKKYVENMKEYV